MDSVSINNVPQELDSSLRELALLYVQCQSCSVLEDGTEQPEHGHHVPFDSFCR